MPNLIAHIDLALDAASELRHPVVDANLGSYILGCCAPDIRIMTHGHREETHFAPITIQAVGTGVKNLLKAYPRLAHAASLSQPTQAFMAGYFSHLVADEAWIIYVYNPYFGNRELFQDLVTANIYDRALQLELDSQAVEKRNRLKSVRGHMANGYIDVEVEFLPTEALTKWCDWLIEYTEWEFTWDRLKMLTRHQYPQDNGTALQIAEDFLRNMPHSLERVYASVPREILRTYRQVIARGWTEIVQEYLS